MWPCRITVGAPESSARADLGDDDRQALPLVRLDLDVAGLEPALDEARGGDQPLLRGGVGGDQPFREYPFVHGRTSLEGASPRSCRVRGAAEGRPRRTLGRVHGAPVIAVHGGAGAWQAGHDDARAALTDALRAGEAAAAVRRRRRSAAVQAAVEVLEDAPVLNAGRGAVPTATGAFELDAAVMDGATRRAGSVAAVRGVRHPIALGARGARPTPHVMIVADGARELAEELGLEIVATTGSAPTGRASPTSPPPATRWRARGGVRPPPTGPSAPSRSTPTGGSPPRPPPAGARSSATAGSATAPSSAPGPTPAASAPSRRRATARS